MLLRAKDFDKIFERLCLPSLLFFVSVLPNALSNIPGGSLYDIVVSSRRPRPTTPYTCIAVRDFDAHRRRYTTVDYRTVYSIINGTTTYRTRTLTPTRVYVMIRINYNNNYIRVALAAIDARAPVVRWDAAVARIIIQGGFSDACTYKTSLGDLPVRDISNKPIETYLLRRWSQRSNSVFLNLYLRNIYSYDS